MLQSRGERSAMSTIEPDPAQLRADWQRLSEFRDPGQAGWTRRPFTAEYRAAREWLEAQMAAAGLATRVDAAGTLIGRRAARREGLATILAGSHIDTVAGGGRFDGMVGVLGALEVARCLGRAGIQLKHPLEVVDFLAEEPTDFGISCVGSRGMTGELDEEALARRDPSGQALAEAMASVGGRPDTLALTVRGPGSVALMLELHIEQGPVLEQEGTSVGIVTGIVGISRYRIDVRGQADHAGTTPMDRRRDALAAAAEVVLALEALWQDAPAPGGVGTAGRMFVSPNAGNVVPAAVELWAEQRSIDAELLRRQETALLERVQEIARRRSVQAVVERVSHEEPTLIPERVQDGLAAVVRGLGLPERRLPSYAGHDTMHVARIAPAGMLFVPSRGGRSHCPEEWTELEEWVTGVRALGEAVVRFDRELAG